MTAYRFVRSAVRARLVALLDEHELLAGRVFAAPGPSDQPASGVTLRGAEQLDTELRDLRAGRKAYRDRFSQQIAIRAADGYDGPLEAEAAADQLAGAIFDQLAADPALGHPRVSGLQFARITSYDGPAAYPVPDGGGWEAYAVVQVEALTEVGGSLP